MNTLTRVVDERGYHEQLHHDILVYVTRPVLVVVGDGAVVVFNVPVLQSIHKQRVTRQTTHSNLSTMHSLTQSLLKQWRHLLLINWTILCLMGQLCWFLCSSSQTQHLNIVNDGPNYLQQIKNRITTWYGWKQNVSTLVCTVERTRIKQKSTESRIRRKSVIYLLEMAKDQTEILDDLRSNDRHFNTKKNINN